LLKGTLGNGYLTFLLIANNYDRTSFFKGSKKDRRLTLSAVLLMNFIFYLFPLIIAFTSTPEGGNIFSEGPNGGGAALWLYIIIFPLSWIIQIVLIVLKVVFATRYKKNLTKTEESLDATV
jgi:uncharacterized membrane protein (DUF485 family)